MEWYKRGTASVTNGSAQVICSKANFVENIERGEAFRGPDGKLYEIKTVVSATEITLTTPYDGATVAAGNYEIIPIQGYPRELAHAAADLIESHRNIEDNTAQALEDVQESLQASINNLETVASGVTTTADNAAAAAASAAAAKTSQTAAAGSATTATTKATESTNQAALAKKWATQTGTEVVAGQGYGAKHYADAAKTSQNAAAESATTASTGASTATSKATEASTSAANAKTSETNAKTSETAAKASQTAAASSASAASTSATASAGSASTASSKATEAATSATNAKTSETNAGNSRAAVNNSAIAAANSATAAAQAATDAAAAIETVQEAVDETEANKTAAAERATAAKASETAAKASQTAAATSASTATTKATEAGTSATNAKTSETNAASSKTAAATSATNAANSATAASTSASAAATSAAAAKSSEVQLAEAVASVRGSMSDGGDWSMATGALPAIPVLSTLWAITAAGTVEGVRYEVGDHLMYSTISGKFSRVNNFDPDTMSLGEANAGTAIENRVITAAVLKAAAQTHAKTTKVNSATAADTAAKLATARTINGVSFDASKNIDIQWRAVSIPAGSDLDTYQTEGVFKCEATVTAETLTGFPTGATAAVAFSMRVWKSAGVIQELTTYLPNDLRKTFQRAYYNNVWSEWARIFTSIDGPSTAELKGELTKEHLARAGSYVASKETRAVFGTNDFDAIIDKEAGGIFLLSGVYVNGPVSASATYTGTLQIVRRVFDAGAAITQIIHQNSRCYYRQGRLGTEGWSWDAWGYQYTSNDRQPNVAALATARTINGVDFDGTKNITIADATKLALTGGTLTGQLNLLNPGALGGIEIKTTDTAQPQLRVVNTLNSGMLQVSSTGNFGLYSIKSGKWLVRSDTEGNVFMPGQADSASVLACGANLTGSMATGTATVEGAGLRVDGIYSGTAKGFPIEYGNRIQIGGHGSSGNEIYLDWRTTEKPRMFLRSRGDVATQTWGAMHQTVLADMGGHADIAGKFTAGKGITSTYANSFTLSARDGGSILSPANAAGTYTPLANVNSTNGTFVLHGYTTRLAAAYVTKANVDSGTNVATHTATLIDETGSGTWTGSLTANDFVHAKSTDGATSYAGNTGALRTAGGIAAAGVSYFGAAVRIKQYLDIGNGETNNVTRAINFYNNGALAGKISNDTSNNLIIGSSGLDGTGGAVGFDSATIVRVNKVENATTTDASTGALRVVGGASIGGNSAFGGRVGMGVLPNTNVQLDILSSQTANGARIGLRALLDVTNQALTASRTQYGAYVRARNQVTYANSKTLGFINVMVGAHVETHSGANATSDLYSSEVYGLRAYAYNNSGATTEPISTVEALRGYAASASPDASTATIRASYAYAHLNNATASAATMTGTEVYVRNQAGTATNGYLYRGAFAGTFDGTKWGMHLAGSTANQIDGYLKLTATTASTSTTTGALIVAGGAGFAGAVWAASFNGNATSATKLATTRALKIGDTSKNFDGTAALTWTLDEIGAVDNLAGQLSTSQDTQGTRLRFISTVASGAQAISGFEIGNDKVGSTPFIDFHSSGKATDYDARIIAGGGTATVAQGTLAIEAALLSIPNTSIATPTEGILSFTAANAYIYGNATNIGFYSPASGGNLYMAHGTGAIYSMSTHGMFVAGNITAYYSDERLKENKRQITGALKKVTSLTGYHYTANDLAASFGYDKNKPEVGLMAQEVNKVVPECVEPAPFDVTEDGGSKSGEHYLTLKYERLVPHLVEAIKELKAIVDGQGKLIEAMQLDLM